MPIDKKRPAPGSATVATGGQSKKRRMDGVQKFYAVRAGFVPGVYLDYADCQKQTAGFKGAVFKSFTSKADAEAFAAGKDVKSDKDRNEPEKFYAVAVGTQTGIYRSWNEASEAIKGAKGPKYKKFPTRVEAVEYIVQFGDRKAIDALGDEAKMKLAASTATDPSLAPTHIAPKPVASAKPVKKGQRPELEDSNVMNIYTDGSSLANGRHGARAGLGVFFGPNDPRNISERLTGDPQTNQRAELMAILRALQTVPLDTPVQIFSDSQYSINCVTQWAIGWKKKGWMTANGEMVKNQDIIRQVLDKMDERTKAGAMTFYTWVKGHATDRGNIAADHLAVEGAKKPAMD